MLFLAPSSSPKECISKSTDLKKKKKKRVTERIKNYFKKHELSLS